MRPMLPEPRVTRTYTLGQWLHPWTLRMLTAPD